VAIKKTALLIDQELVAQVKALLDTSTTTETITEAMREVIRMRGRARHFERLRQRAADLTDPQVMGEQWVKGERRLGTYGDGSGDPPR
jgi:Arc/MetJ family transcription regulator